MLQPPLLALPSRPQTAELLERAAQGGRLVATVRAPQAWPPSPGLFTALSRTAARTGTRAAGPWEPTDPREHGLRTQGRAYAAPSASGKRLVAVEDAAPGSFWLYALPSQPAQAWYNNLFGAVHYVGDKALRIFSMGTISDSISSAAGDSLPDWARTDDQRKAAELTRPPVAPTPPTPPELPTRPLGPEGPVPPEPPAETVAPYDVQTWVSPVGAPLSREERRQRKWAQP